MSDFQRCSICREYGWLNETGYLRHVCKPKWECRADWQDDDEWSSTHATDAQIAAEKFAERYDCEGGDYTIVGNKMRNDVIVLVRKSEDDPVERFAIEAETVPVYHATKQP